VPENHKLQKAREKQNAAAGEEPVLRLLRKTSAGTDKKPGGMRAFHKVVKNTGLPNGKRNPRGGCGK